ncbi:MULTISPECIES: hypothetical protein [Wolbachia]|uniref:hypothetical protein n=1 Tax=Wolbachia TaxID=953 RepID=UPI00397C3E80
MCSLLCSHLFKVKFSGSQCLGTGMTRKGALEFLFQYLYISHTSEQIPPLNGYTVEGEFLLPSKD